MQRLLRILAALARLPGRLIPRPSPAYSRTITQHTPTTPRWRRLARNTALFIVMAVLFAVVIVVWSLSYAAAP